jgi:hypothetical protein
MCAHVHPCVPQRHCASRPPVHVPCPVSPICRIPHCSHHCCTTTTVVTTAAKTTTANTPTGVWRIKAINDAGGWESDTVVEDMDLSLRVYLRGWRSIYLHDVKCPNELPSTLSAYKTQQFRWLSGPMQIVRKSFANIWRSR